MSELNEKLQEVQKGLDDLGAAPHLVGRVADESIDVAEAYATQRELRKKFSKMNRTELGEMLDIQATREGGKQASSDVLNRLAVANPNIAKLLDSTGGTALIRQDLEPILYALFVKKFPFFERIRKEPANGLVHAFNQQSAFGDAVFQTETGTVTDDVNTYARQTTNVAVLATRRGITLKSQFAITQGGAPGQQGLSTELEGGVTAIAKKLQKTLFQGNADTTASAGTATELGAYDANGFTGLRKLLGAAAATAQIVNKGTAAYLATINDNVASILNAGGNPSAILCTPADYAGLVNELTNLVRYNAPAQTAQTAGATFGSVVTAAGELPILAVPGDSIGGYTASSVNYRDMYVVDESVWSMPYLGSDSITTLEIPVGTNGSLSRLYIMYCMYGLASKAPQFNGKIRVTTA
ncbi:hypothetical protein UFOVP1131_45 [uncultured Caudovirales phage]|uniref:Uncharacterized protein n=1 Tax=uncultured Caudovirales phage TaxID=2100421 RepID=A0A6J5RD04_9CAUD|nr:hypothetical protein UFOVP966_59 [uncultured Caudovirales phage]CAB4184898.1 hypothetical protein UFOVP1131_45 [uncultured Caudovirales phage]CAB4192356.1 hypothetical protein UFOVP1245_17 [uncultured Caudovirales phage]CAB5231193.1 hypothetical protein UFOVP1582_37 [uncultured Caudovirales phage]